MADLTTGTAIAGYRIEATLGHGSMGTVYSALDTGLDRRVALKVLTPELYRDERFRERFLRESKLAASLEHPHIVPIYAAGEADGSLYLVMRYIEGRDLSALLKSLGRLDPERTLEIVRQVASALDVAHERGLVHRDVKPANILLTRHGGDDYAYLCDFGLAKHASTVSSLTGSRAIVGTVDYLAPEQIEGRPVDGRVDVYALGCVLYECLAGAPPFERGNELAALLAHVNDPSPVLSERRAELPAALDVVVTTALAKDRDLRYSTCGELVEAAEAAVRGDVPVAPAPARATAEAVRTFLFADVRGYTAYTRAQGDEAAATLASRFAAVVEQLAPKHAGTLQELRGDEALVVFDSARQALRFALALQAEVEAAELPRPVGIGLDAGEAIPVEGGFRGGALNRAARLCALARPGEVLASDAVRELAGPSEGVAYGFRRVERLKGFEKPVGVVEVHPGERAPTRELGRRARRAVAGTRPRLRLAVAAVVVAAVAAVVAVLGTEGGGQTTGSRFRANTIGFLDAKTLKPAGSLAQLGAPFALWRDPSGYVWAGAAYGGSLERIDPHTQQVTTTIQFGIDVGSVGFGAASVWVGDDDAPAVNRYDATYGTLQKRIALPYPKGPKYDYPGFTEGIAFGAGSIWVGYGKYQFRVARIDPATNRITKIFDFPNSDGPPILAFGAGSVWIVSVDRGNVYRIDPRTDEIAMHTKLHGGPVSDLAVVDGYAWMPVQGDGAVWQVDRNGNVLRSFTTGALPIQLGARGGRVYVANEQAGSISRIDPATGNVSTVRVGHNAETAIVAGGRVWVALNPSAADVSAGLPARSTVRVGTVDDPYFTTDPAILSVGNTQLQGAIGARLLRSPDVAQPDGVTLLPEIADLPTVSNGGRTYTFRIRPGWRFSPPSNAPVTAEVMRYSIERALSPKFTQPTFGPAIMNDLVGFKAYQNGKAAHIAGLRAEGNDLSITLTEPDPDLPARLSETYFSAVPLGTPVRPHGVDQPIPSAGPYYISVNSGSSTLVLRRNPNYHGPRPHRLRAIVLERNVGASAPEQAASGRSDYSWTDSTPPTNLAVGGPLDHRFGPGSAAARVGRQRYFDPPSAGVRMVQFNAASGIFRNPRLRRAVNYALDRPALAAASNDTPAEDVLAPGDPGAGRTPIYPLRGPDLAAAKRLARGVHARAVLLSGRPQDCPPCAAWASTIRADLAAIGIDVEVQTPPDRFGAASDPHTRWDMLIVTYLMDYPDPSDFLNVMFDGARPLPDVGPVIPWARYTDVHYLEEMRAAYHAPPASRAEAYRRVDADMFRNSPPAAVFATPAAQAQIFSSRVGCQVFRPQDFGLVDLAALCLRGKA